jgi:hypothetical protein
MKAKLTALMVSGFILLLGGCIVVPVDPGYGYAGGAVYVAPPVVRGYWGYGRAHWGYRHGGW